MNLKKFLKVVNRNYVSVRFTDEDDSWNAGGVDFTDDILENSKIVNVNYKDEVFYILVKDMRV